MAVLNDIRLTRMNADGTYPANPVVFNFCIEAEDLKANPKYSDIACLLKKTVDKVRGSDDVNGSITMNATKQNVGLFNLFYFGTKDSEEDITTDAWASDTVYAVGDQVNTGDGKYTLTCKRVKDDGKSGSDEPTPSKLNKTEIIQDNNVTWEATPKIVITKGTLKDEAPLFAVEYKIDDDGTTTYIRYEGCEFSSLPLKMSIDDKPLQIQANIVGAKVVTSLDADWDSNLLGKTGAVEVNLGDDYYRADDDAKIALINDNGRCMNSVDITLDKGITAKKGINGCNTLTRDIKCDGSLDMYFTQEEFTRIRNEEAFDLKIKTISTGCYVTYHFPTVKAEAVQPSIESKEDVLLKPNLWALDDPFLVEYENARPLFLDTDGNIVDI